MAAQFWLQGPLPTLRTAASGTSAITYCLLITYQYKPSLASDTVAPLGKDILGEASIAPTSKILEFESIVQATAHLFFIAIV